MKELIQIITLIGEISEANLGLQYAQGHVKNFDAKFKEISTAAEKALCSVMKTKSFRPKKFIFILDMEYAK